MLGVNIFEHPHRVEEKVLTGGENTNQRPAVSWMQTNAIHYAGSRPGVGGG